jgi:hypothetical protein
MSDPNDFEERMEDEWEDFLEGVEEVSGDDSTLKVGFPEGTSATGDRDISETAHVALIHEYGAPDANIPARPFIRPTIDENEEKYFDLFMGLVEAVVIDNAVDLETVYEQLGSKVVADIQAAIRARTKPLLNAEYVERDPYKESRSNPLVRHGWMKQSVDHVVEED